MSKFKIDEVVQVTSCNAFLKIIKIITYANIYSFTYGYNVEKIKGIDKVDVEKIYREYELVSASNIAQKLYSN